MYTFQQLNNACTNCTSFFIRKGKDADGELIYHLIDGCGEEYGDPFEELEDVEDYITNNEEVQRLSRKELRTMTEAQQQQQQRDRLNGRRGGLISSGTLYRSLVNGFVSTAAGLTRYHQKRGWPVNEREQIASGVCF